MPHQPQQHLEFELHFWSLQYLGNKTLMTMKLKGEAANLIHLLGSTILTYAKDAQHYQYCQGESPDVIETNNPQASESAFHYH